MKNFRDYLSESEEAADNPVAGDTFAINIREECLIESVVIESRDDGVVIAADDRMIELLESYGYTFEENCMECGMPDCGCGDPAAYSDDEPAADPDEYDDEGDMAKDELMTMIRSARRLIGMLDNADNMPEWTQKKINKATDYVDTASDYISSQKERGVMEQGAALPDIRGLGSDAQALILKLRRDVEDKRTQPTPQAVLAAARELAGDMEFAPLLLVQQVLGKGVTEGSGETSPVARATLHRIMMRHPGMLAQHGPERVMKAVDDVADLVGDMDDIGSSDISGWVNMVQEILDSLDQDVAEGWKEKLGAAALAGSMAFGAGAAQAQSATKNQVSAKPVATQQASAKSDPFTVNGKTMPQNVRTALFKMSDEDGQQAYTAWRTLVSGTGAQNQMQAGQVLTQLMQKYSVNEQDASKGEIDDSRMNQQHKDFYNQNPHFKRNDRETKFVGNRLATKVSPANPQQVKKKPATPFGITEAATMASVSKLLRHIERHHPTWFDDYGMGEVEDTVVDMAEQGTFSGMTVVDAAALVGQELESMYGADAMSEAEYQGRKVPLGKPMRGDVKKSKVYVKNPQGNVVKVNFGDPDMKIKKSNPDRRKNFRARHNCDNPGPRHKARYWSCRAW
jgi:hypothetical protein